MVDLDLMEQLLNTLRREARMYGTARAAEIVKQWDTAGIMSDLDVYDALRIVQNARVRGDTPTRAEMERDALRRKLSTLPKNSERLNHS